MAKFISAEEAVDLIFDGATIMFGGFMGCGSAHKIIDTLSKSGKSNFTMICNDAARQGGPMGEGHYATAKLIHNHQIKHLIASHVGLNPEVAEQMNSGSLQVDLIPQGSLVEMIRANGAGLGGVITPTGVGTIVAENTDFVYGEQTFDGQRYLVMKPIKADFAIIAGCKIDRSGNIWYKGDTSNFNIVMATAADVVIAEAEQIVELQEIAPEDVRTPGVLVDYVVQGGPC